MPTSDFRRTRCTENGTSGLLSCNRKETDVEVPDMQFYKYEGSIVTEAAAEENDRIAARQRARKIAMKSNFFNQKQKNTCFLFVSDASENMVTVGMIVQKHIDVAGHISAFLRSLEIEAKDARLEEITLSTLRNMLSCADRYDYIEDDDEILERFELDMLGGRFSREIDYDEAILTSGSKKAVYDDAAKFLAKDSVAAELDRIYAGSARHTAIGHPVHYIVQTDDADTREEMCQVLLRALYANNRLCNKRYCSLDFKPGNSSFGTVYDYLYKSNVGGAVIVRYHADDDTEEEYASSGRETIETLCEVMKKYNNRVLTVFCLPRECTRSKDIFYENFGNTSIVELKEDFVYGEQAAGFLKMLAKDNGVRTDKKLFAKLEEEKGYLAPELRNLFDDWYNHKLKRDIYPQYKDIATAKHEVVKAAPKGSAYDALNQMVGLDEAKKVIHRALNYYKAQKLFADKGMKADHPAMHMVFTGNPGTAKTTVARLFARIMKENNLLSKGNLIEVGRGDLVGKYVGWTAPTIQKKFKEAQGSVLFIDEAYSLVDDRSGSFGDEAINTIVQEMENHREDVVVIFAGYPDKMESFLQKNPGLRSRIAYHVPFADYDTQSLCVIAKLIAGQKGLTLTDEACDKLTKLFDTARTESDFGNGRYVRNVIEKARMAQATRLLSMEYDQIKSRDIATITAEDIEIPERTPKTGKKRIGFCS